MGLEPGNMMLGGKLLTIHKFAFAMLPRAADFPRITAE